MDGEEDEASKVTVNELPFEVEGGELVVDEEVPVVQRQCEPALRAESDDERLGMESSPPPRREFDEIVGNDVVGGADGDENEETNDGDIKKKEKENEATAKKDWENEVCEEEKHAEESPVEEIVADEVDAVEAAETKMSSEKGEFDGLTAVAEVRRNTPERGDFADLVMGENERVPEEGGSAYEAEESGFADVAVLETEIISEKGGLGDAAAEENEMVPEEEVVPVDKAEESGLADVAAVETEIISEKGSLGDVAAEENEMVPEEESVPAEKAEESGLADVAVVETETISEKGSLGDVVAEENETVPEEEGGLGDKAEESGLADVVVVETEIISEKGSLGDVAAEENEKATEEDGGLADKAVETEIVSEKGGSGDTASAENEMVPNEGDVADVAAEETKMVQEERSPEDMAEETRMLPEETGTVSEEGGLAEMVAEESEMGEEAEADETGIAEERRDVTSEETVMANVGGDGVEVEGVEATKEEEEEEAEEEEEDLEEEEEEGGPGEERQRKEAEPEEGDAMEAESEEEVVKVEETEAADAMEEDEAELEGMEVAEKASGGVGGGKRKRGKNLKAPARATSRKKMEEDVCFICFDGGELVLCDRRGCPKAYHPTCVNRDDAFFRSKGRWNCGWHQCSNCGKNAHYMCYTCTFSLCKACVKDATILCVRRNKGFCETCMRTVKLIEKNEGNTNDNVNFDDKSSWEYLFKDYYTDLKENLSLTFSELAEAKNPWKGSDSQAYKRESADEPFDPNNDVDSDSDGSSGNLGPSNSKRRKTRKRAKSRSKDTRRKVAATDIRGISVAGSNEWASKELLEFVMHMRDGDASVMSQFDVQALLLEYIKRNKLRDPRRKSQIICDTRLQNIFGKARVGHFEMLKLLESHFLIKEDSHVDDLQGSVVDTETSQLEVDGNSDAPGKSSKDKKRKNRRKGDAKGRQYNLDDYAAIDTHNINLIYLRRNLVEDLIDDAESFHDQAVGAFVRIRIAGSNQKQDLYRLVQVVGTSKAAEPYKVGKKTTDVCLEILNLSKTETVSMDIISNQEFTEEECKRLRQSIKCGLINRLTVGDIQEKAIALQAVRVKDWLESEIVRLSHLRDRASETGRRKELRECVEKLQLLKAPEERQRRLEEIPEIHTDPNMDPSFESEEEEADDKRRENFMKARSLSFSRRGREPISPRIGGSALSGTRSYSNTTSELSRNISARGLSAKMEESSGVGEIVNDLWNQGRDREVQPPNTWEKHKMSTLETGSRSAQSAMTSSEPFSPIVSENSATSKGVSEPATKINESEKIWHYKDPSGKIQGPFSVLQLRKWNATGYFPADLKIWKQTETQDDSLPLTDVLSGKIQKDKVQFVQNLHPSPLQSTKIQVGVENWRSQNESDSLRGKVVSPNPVEVSKHSSEVWNSTNLPSPTPPRTPLAAAKVQASESKWSGNSVQSSGSLLGVDQFPGNTRATQEGMSRVPENNSTPSKPEQISAPVLNHASGADIQSVVSNLQSLVQSVASHLPPAETRGWVQPEMTVSNPMPGGESQTWRGTPSQKPEPNNPAMMHGQPPAHGHWNDVSTIHNPTSSFNTANAAGNFPSTGFQASAPPSDPWRPQVSSNQPNAQLQNPGWVPPVPANQNMGWGGPPPQNPNMNWGVPGQSTAPGNTNTPWGPSPNQGPATNWGPPPVNANANQGWGGGGHPQGPQPGNANTGWSPAPIGNQGTWAGEQSHNSDRFGNHDPGHGRGRPWARQPSFGNGGGSSRPPFRGQRVCKYHKSGHCKKGAACDYLHT